MQGDPKPGRWILPIVIAGLVGFTLSFVGAVPQSSSTTSTTLGTNETTTTTTTESPTGTATTSTTSTTLDPALEAFLTQLADNESTIAALAADATQLNEDWDNRDDTFGNTRDGLADLETRTGQLATALEATTLPDESVANPWTAVVAAADRMQDAADVMLDGLVNSSGSERRLGALADYTEAANLLLDALSDARTAAGG